MPVSVVACTFVSNFDTIISAEKKLVEGEFGAGQVEGYETQTKKIDKKNFHKHQAP